LGEKGVTVELLKIVEAEQQADALVKEAQERKELAIKKALEERQFKLSNLKVPETAQPKLKPLNPDLERIKQVARKNRSKAIKAILEELHVQE
jgi:hypothetical protein